jgi:hypothetical protein
VAEQPLQDMESRSGPWFIYFCTLSGEPVRIGIEPDEYAESRCPACKDALSEPIEVVPLDDSFIGLVKIAELILDRHYPIDVFNAANPIVGNDLGTQLVVALRAVREAMTSG